MTQKIIHIDMDCFYAAVEIRDNPSLVDKPVAVGGLPEQRGVLCTCNYIARQYGVKSAMATAYAYRLCKDLIVLPVNMQKYRAVSQIIHKIFREFTDLVEPLSLDEAYLDVTHSAHFNGSATGIAQEIRQRIFDTVKLTASAGVAPNKFLAKIASGWKKPNGIFVIPPQKVADFVKDLPIKNLFGVGKVTAEKLHQAGFSVCADLYPISLMELTEKFGKLGKQLYEQSRGIDQRAVEPNRVRKSLSVEHTLRKDISTQEESCIVIRKLYERLVQRLQHLETQLPIKNYYLKIKYSNFKQATIERTLSLPMPTVEQYENLLTEIGMKSHLAIRLFGVGVHFQTSEINQQVIPLQQSLPL